MSARTRARWHDPRTAILLGASHGSADALGALLPALPADLPGIVIVRHHSGPWAKTFADQLNPQCALEVREAVDGDLLNPGTALVAPGNFHVLLHWTGRRHQVRIVGGPLVWRQRPSIDLLFKSAAEAGTARHCLAGVLAGTGRDGVAGLQRLRELGATTFAQDGATAIAESMLPTNRLAAWIHRHPDCNPSIARAITSRVGRALWNPRREIAATT